MKVAYVLPDPSPRGDWAEFDADLACMKQAGYDAVELQIPDPVRFDENRVRRLLTAVGYDLCSFQTGSSYYTHGNCLCTPDVAIRQRTIQLMRSFVDLAARWRSVIVFGSLQGRLSDEPNRSTGEERIAQAMHEIGQYASDLGVTIAFEPVQHGEVGFHNTIARVAALVRRINLPGLRMMVDSFHMNIEERDMIAPVAGIADILSHVHLSETNRDVLGTGHWPTRAFLAELQQIGYTGSCAIGVYNTRHSRRECIVRCREALDAATKGQP